MAGGAEDCDHEMREIHGRKKGTDWAGDGRTNLRQSMSKAQIEPRFILPGTGDQIPSEPQSKTVPDAYRGRLRSILR